MIVPLGALQHEVPAGGRADPEVYDRAGYAVGRGVFEPDLIRKLRAPVIEGLVAEGQIEAVEGEEDRFAWRGDGSSFEAQLGKYQKVLKDDAEQLLVASGVAGRAIEAMWGRRAAIWRGGGVYAMMPNGPDYVHRDGWPLMGLGGPHEHIKAWIPLTALGSDDGQLAIALGTHRIEDQPPEVPRAHPMHTEGLFYTGHMPAEEVLAPLWRTTSFEIGDAMAFQPYNVHSASPNTGPYLRIAIGLYAQDARVALSPKAGLSLDPGRDLVAVEWLTLAVLAVQASTQWMVLQAFYPRGIIGRLWSAHFDDLVMPAFRSLENRGLIEVHESQPGRGEWIHRYFHITDQGRSEVSEWLARPCSDDNQLLSVKLLFCDWLGLDTTEQLVNRVHVGAR